MTTLGALIKSRRLQKGMTQMELAEALDYTRKRRGYISDIERDIEDVPVNKVFDLCEILDLDFHDIIPLLPDTPNYQLLMQLMKQTSSIVAATDATTFDIHWPRAL